MDFEIILGGLEDFEIVDNIRQANICLVNTCAFIESATQESIDTILEISQENPNVKLFVSGCLPQRYGKELIDLLPEVDLFLTCQNPRQAAEQIRSFLGLPEGKESYRRPLTPLPYAYVKISEGCDNRCSYCTIPSIKGGFRSRSQEKILQTAYQLADQGVRELILVAQDTTSYGKDLGVKNGLAKLLNVLHRIKGIEWIRIMYTHPAGWDDYLIDAVAEMDKVVKYIDLPIQHVSDSILERMGRRVTRKQIEVLIEKMRERIPMLALRTSLILGFPGEGHDEFNELVEFVEKQKFDRLGAFEYSAEEGTRALNWTDDVTQRTKTERRNMIMELQADISAFKNQSLIGQKLLVLVDQYDRDRNSTIGRTQWDAPEIDNTVILPETVQVGRFYRAEIQSADVYDLYAI
ncbi:30S ribosomal protein S12 methylthiotransferase RimO [candidate division KSB1 bacterium]|nr:30S ribosomal protein S12 methylthiotransferase RimO [candidate division KSB1 bacterium]